MRPRRAYAMTPADWIILLGGAALAVTLAVLAWRPAGAPRVAEIYAGGELARTVSLNRETRVAVAGPLGETRIEFRDGRARFVASPCRNKLCIRSGWLEDRGDSAACLPNRVSLVLTGPGEPRYDAINY